MICAPGRCCVCEKPIVSGGRPTGEYTEVETEWSNGTKMRIGVCMTCATSNAWATPEAKDGIAKAHFDYWEKQGGTPDRTLTLV